MKKRVKTASKENGAKTARKPKAPKLPKGTFLACRFHGDAEAGIAVYDPTVDVAENPEEYQFFFTRDQWKKMGGRLPPANGKPKTVTILANLA